MPSITTYELDPTNHQGMLSDYSPHKNQHKIGSNYYWITPDTNVGVAGATTDHTVRAWKSANAQTWTEQDGTHRRSLKYQPNAVERNGAQIVRTAYHAATNKLWVAYLLQDTVAGIGTLMISDFSPATNTWGTEYNTGLQVYLMGGHQTQLEMYHLEIEVLDNGKIRILYNGLPETIAAVNYDRIYADQFDPSIPGLTPSVGAALAGQSGVARYFWLDGTIQDSSICHVIGHSRDFTGSPEWRLHSWTITPGSSISSLNTMATDGWVGTDNGQNYGTEPVIAGGKIFALYGRNSAGNNRIGCYVGSPSNSASPTWTGPEDPTGGSAFAFFALGASGNSGNGLFVAYPDGDFQEIAFGFLRDFGAEPVIVWTDITNLATIHARTRSSGGTWSSTTDLVTSASYIAALMCGAASAARHPNYAIVT